MSLKLINFKQRIEITISDPDIDFKPGYLENKNHSTHSITVDGVELEIEGGIWLN